MTKASNYWKHRYLQFMEEIETFIENNPPSNRVTSLLNAKLQALRSLLSMEVNGYDGEMEEDLIAYMEKSDKEAYLTAKLFPPTPNDRE